MSLSTEEQFFDAIKQDDSLSVLSFLDNGFSVRNPSRLSYAASNNALNCIKLLLERGADINAPSLVSEMTPLMLAAYMKHHEAMTVLLSYPSSTPIDIHARDLYGRTATSFALDFSASARETPNEAQAIINANQCLKLLSQFGVDITKETNQRNELLASAFINNSALTTKYPEISRDIVNTFILNGFKLTDKNSRSGSRKELNIKNNTFVILNFKEFEALENAVAEHRLLSSTIKDEHGNNNEMSF